MHIYGSLHRQRTGVKTVHIAEILASTRTAAAKTPTFTHASGKAGGNE
jgi:hypothetical protein